MPKLHTEAQEKFKKDGYFILNEPIFSEDDFSRIISIFNDLSNKNKQSDIDLMDVPHFRDSTLLDLLFNERILDLAESFIGPNIGLWSSHFISKPPLTGKATPWHEDSAYWEGRFDRMDGIVTIWLALDRSNKENGCMKVIPGTQQNGFSDYEDVNQDENIFHNQIKNVDDSKAVYFELNPNECSFHEGRIIHGADANKSTRRRAGFTIRYFSQQMKYIADNPINITHKIWHCRGKNIHNNIVVN
ncbi:MAG: phytanoyl-CoA dioxygenase family protein [Saprospiraceae bacterium]